MLAFFTFLQATAAAHMRLEHETWLDDESREPMAMFPYLSTSGVFPARLGASSTVAGPHQLLKAIMNLGVVDGSPTANDNNS